MIPIMGHLPLSTGYVLVSLLSCDPNPPADIHINFQNNPVQIDNTKTSEYLARLKEKSVSPHYGSEFPITGGITDGNFKITFDMDFLNTIRPLLNKACVHIKNVDITVAYTPTVYIANNYPPGTCRYELTKEHEMKHVNVDIDTLKYFFPDIKAVSEAAVAQWQKPHSVSKKQIEPFQNNILEQFSDTLKKTSDALQQVRVLRQKEIDSRAEYQYLSAACADEPAR